MLLMMFVLLALRWSKRLNGSQVRRSRRTKTPLDPQLAKLQAPWRRTRAKPPWVGDELVRMKAFGPKLGYMKLAEAFNRRFVEERGMSVAPSTVRRILLKRGAEVIALRREVRNRVPQDLPRNVEWGLDLTTVTDITRRQRLVLGIVDHGTRACIALRELSDKRSLTILRDIISTIRQFGFPDQIRVDNDPSLKSRLMRAALRALGVKLQVVQIACPWMNGRIERFFGTFKAAITRIVIEGTDLPHRLIEFRTFYNHIRTHQHLGGRTPAEAWSGVAKQHGTHGEFISLWHGELSGWYFPKRE